MIHPATPADIPALLAMGRAFHAASSLPFRFDDDAMAAVFARMIGSDDAVILMSDRGAIGGVLNPAYCDPAWIMAVEVFWWSSGGGLSLLAAFEEWARDRGAQEVRMTSLAALPRAAGILARRGYAQTEISHMKVL